MLARDLITDSIPPLKTSDTGAEALNWMQEFQVKHLPIVNDLEFLGLIAEDDILNVNQPDAPIGSYQLSYFKPFVMEGMHLFDVFKAFAKLELTVLPVVNDNNAYMGLITPESLVQCFAKNTSLAEPGGILVLEMSASDYSLSELSRIAESDDIQIVSLFTTIRKDTTKLQVTIKFNREDIQSLIASYQRFKYDIVASFQKVESQDLLQERYSALMNYLNI